MTPAEIITSLGICFAGLAALVKSLAALLTAKSGDLLRGARGPCQIARRAPDGHRQGQEETQEEVKARVSE